MARQEKAIQLVRQPAPSTPSSGQDSFFSDTFGRIGIKDSLGIVKYFPYEFFYNVRDYGAVGNGTTDDSSAIQAALDLASSTNAGATVFFPPGTYKVNSELEIKGSCTIQLDNAATVIRGVSTMQYIFKNFNASYAPTLYGGRSGITIRGGTIDGGATTLTTSCTSVVFAHCEDILVEDVTFQNVVDWHGVELNSTRIATVRNCIFQGFRVVTAGRFISEAIQIDLAINSSALPGIGAGAYDSTPCQAVTIDGNLVRAFGSYKGFGCLTGSHSWADTKHHMNIRVVNNTCYDMSDYMVNAQNWTEVVISNNICENCNGGINFEIPSGLTINMECLIVDSNSFRTMGLLNDNTAINPSVIGVIGLLSPSNPVREAVISNNIIRTYANPAGITAQNVADFMATGNVVKNGTDAASKAFDIISSANAVINGNKVDTVKIGVHVRNVTLTSAGAQVSGNVFASCTNTAVQAALNQIMVQGNLIRACGNAGTTAAIMFTGADYGTVMCNIIWDNAAGVTNGLNINSTSQGTMIVANAFKGYGSTTSATNIVDSNTGTVDDATTLSTTEKYMSAD